MLIEKGVLKGYLQDRLNATLMKTPLTGNGRRESFAHIPMPRMTNTFMLPGEATPEEIIRSVKKGRYAVYFGGGQVATLSPEAKITLVKEAEATALDTDPRITNSEGTEFTSHASNVCYANSHGFVGQYRTQLSASLLCP